MNMRKAIKTAINPKHETRNPKQYRNPNFQNSKRVSNFSHLIFGFVSTNSIKSGEIRISNFILQNNRKSCFSS